jgi:hypothetical protein
LFLSEEIMKKIGFLIFIAAIVVGVVFSNLISFEFGSGKLSNFSLDSSVKGSGVTASEARSTADFDGVSVEGVFELEIRVGKDFSVEVEADDNLLQYIKTEVDGGILNIETTEGVKSSNPIRIRVTSPEINTLRASGASKVSLAGVNNSSLDVESSGASKITMEGETSEVRIEASGASSVDAEALKAASASVDSSGASKVSVFAIERLVSDASGASKIAYSGNPASVEKNTSGSSRVHRK